MGYTPDQLQRPFPIDRGSQEVSRGFMNWSEVGRLQRNFDSMEDPYYWETEEDDEPLTEEDDHEKKERINGNRRDKPDELRQPVLEKWRRFGTS